MIIQILIETLLAFQQKVFHDPPGHYSKCLQVLCRFFEWCGVANSKLRNQDPTYWWELPTCWCACGYATWLFFRSRGLGDSMMCGKVWLENQDCSKSPLNFTWCSDGTPRIPKNGKLFIQLVAVDLHHFSGTHFFVEGMWTHEGVLALHSTETLGQKKDLSMLDVFIFPD